MFLNLYNVKLFNVISFCPRFPDAADVHVGTSPEIVTVAEGASAKMATLAVLAVGWTEGKTGLCATLM